MDVFHALSAPTRRGIVEMLSKKDRMSAMDIADKFDASPPAISQHLKVLREAKILHMEKQGKQRFYYLDPNAMLELSEWTQMITKEWQGRLDRLENVLTKGTIKNKKK